MAATGLTTLLPNIGTCELGCGGCELGGVGGARKGHFGAAVHAGAVTFAGGAVKKRGVSVCGKCLSLIHI